MPNPIEHPGFKDQPTFTCCICGDTISGQWGNNPWPIKPEGKCCDECNWQQVILARLRWGSGSGMRSS